MIDLDVEMKALPLFLHRIVGFCEDYIFVSQVCEQNWSEKRLGHFVVKSLIKIEGF